MSNPKDKKNGILVYDLEIVQAIPQRNKAKEPDIVYCAGWEDHANMGVSVIGAYDSLDDRFRVFTKEGFSDFEQLAHNRILVGFNSIHFDDEVLKHVGVNVTTDFDLLQELWVGAGLGREFVYTSHAGFGLDATAKANGVGAKTGWGGSAPIQWQRKEYGRVIDYCLEDVRLTWRLMSQVMDFGFLRDPRNPAELLTVSCSSLQGDLAKTPKEPLNN